MATMTYEGRLTILTCWCGIKHAVPQSLRDEQMRQHDAGERNVLGVYCPLGHVHVPAGEGESARLRRQLEFERNARARVAAERDQAQADARAQKAAKTRIKNDRDRIKGRVANGVCPECNRTFANLARHMASKHPNCKEAHATTD